MGLRIDLNNFCDSEIHLFGSIEYLKNCKTLKNLCLIVYHLNEKCLKDIHIYLPQLKSIQLNYYSINNISEIFDSIANLSLILRISTKIIL
jgi:hypothetical protein